MKKFSLQEINEVLKGTILGNTNQLITAPEQLEVASNSEISFTDTIVFIILIYFIHMNDW